MAKEEFLFNKKVKVFGKEYLLKIYKEFRYQDSLDGKPYYIYHCNFYKEENFNLFGLFPIKRLVKTFGYRTYWLNYYRYRGDINKVIQEAIKEYELDVKEREYVLNKEKEFVEGGF